ncbi:hypothetical protein RMATCC62417_17930 [Rhizopus microsporus]|nr:hypothetical protein RMATCC62417_17930 [Rhizopus microsporus]
MDYTLQSDDFNTAPNNMEEDEDMEELLQIQRDRLDRLRKVILLGMDADAAKANSDNKEDLLF